MKKIICFTCLIAIGFSLVACSTPESTDQPIVIPIPEEYTILEVRDYEWMGAYHNEEISLFGTTTVEYENYQETFSVNQREETLNYRSTIFSAYYQEDSEYFYAKHENDNNRTVSLSKNRRTQEIRYYESYCNHIGQSIEAMQQKSRDECYNLAYNWLQQLIPNWQDYSLTDETHHKSRYRKDHIIDNAGCYVFEFSKTVCDVKIKKVSIRIGELCDCCVRYGKSFSGITNEIFFAVRGTNESHLESAIATDGL